MNVYTVEPPIQRGPPENMTASQFISHAYIHFKTFLTSEKTTKLTSLVDKISGPNISEAPL